MNFVWSIVLLLSLGFAVAGPLFFGHALIAHDSRWFGASAVCVAIAAGLVFIQARFRPDRRTSHP